MMIALTVPPPISQLVASPALPVRRVHEADKSNWTNAQGTGDATSASTRHSASDGRGDSCCHLLFTVPLPLDLIRVQLAILVTVFALYLTDAYSLVDALHKMSTAFE